MGQFKATDIGSVISAKAGIKATNSTGGAINGTGVDRMVAESQEGYLSCVFVVQNGDATGSPTSYTIDGKLQESDDNSTWADISGATITQITANNTTRQKDVNLVGAKRYIRAVVTPTFTGGSTPAVPVSATIVLGGAFNPPVT